MASAVANYSQSLEELNRSSFPNDGERSKALLAAYALVSRLETPWETVLRLSMGQVSFQYFCSNDLTSLLAEASFSKLAASSGCVIEGR